MTLCVRENVYTEQQQQKKARTFGEILQGLHICFRFGIKNHEISLVLTTEILVW